MLIVSGNSRIMHFVINKIVANCCNCECESAARRIIEADDEAPIDNDIYLSQIIIFMKVLLGQFISAMHRSRMASSLDEQDIVRSECLKDVYYILRGACRMNDRNTSNAAELLIETFGTHGIRVSEACYTVDSEAIDCLISIFSTKESLNQIEYISGLTEKMNDLHKAHDRFKNMQMQSKQRNIKDTESYTTASEIKKEVVALINDKLVVYLRAMVDVDEVKYRDYAVKVRTIIYEINDIAKKRTKEKTVL